MCCTTSSDGTIVRNIFEKETVKHDKIHRFWAITIQHGQSLVVHSTKTCHLLLVVVTFHWQQKTKGLNYLSKFLAMLQYIHLCTSIWNVAALIHLFFRNTTYIPRFFFKPTHSQGLVNVPIEHHPTIGDIITKQILFQVMFKILKTGHLPQDGTPQWCECWFILPID